MMRAMRYALVTGASSGIGLETARGLTEHFDVVGIVGRNVGRLQEALVDLTQGPARIESFVCDFSRLADVERLVLQVIDRFDALHALVNNAGVWHTDGERRLSEDGYENTFAVNHLAHFVLTLGLQDLLKSSAPARVIHVSSVMQARCKAMNWDDIMLDEYWGGFKAYAQSKLANVLLSNAMARRWEGTGVTSNAVHPGNVQTNIVRDHKVLQWLLDLPIAPWFVKTAAQGAAASLKLATDPAFANTTGKYFHMKKERAPNPIALDQGEQERLWKLSEDLVAKALKS